MLSAFDYGCALVLNQKKVPCCAQDSLFSGGVKWTLDCIYRHSSHRKLQFYTLQKQVLSKYEGIYVYTQRQTKKKVLPHTHTHTRALTYDWRLHTQRERDTEGSQI